MTNKEAVEAIKSNWPAERYSVLRQALSKAIRALEREDRREERENEKNIRNRDGRRVSNMPASEPRNDKPDV